MRTLIPILSLFVLVTSGCDQADRNLHSEMLNMLDIELAEEYERFEYDYQDYIERLTDPGKIRYRKIQIPIDSIKVHRERLQEKGVEIITAASAGQSVDLNAFQNELLKADSLILQDFEALFAQEHTNWGMKNDEYLTFLNRIRDDYKALKQRTLVNDLSQYFSGQRLSIRLKLIEKFGLSRLKFLEKRIMVFSSSRVIACFPSFVAVAPEIACVNLGDTFKANIYIGQYFADLDFEKTLMIVNNDTMHLGEKGYIEYVDKQTERGEQELKIECLIFDPLNEAYFSNQSYYTFYVR